MFMCYGLVLVIHICVSMWFMTHSPFRWWFGDWGICRHALLCVDWHLAGGLIESRNPGSNLKIWYNRPSWSTETSKYQQQNFHFLYLFHRWQNHKPHISVDIYGLCFLHIFTRAFMPWTAKYVTTILYLCLIFFRISQTVLCDIVI